jgi:TRAP transporter TAXI family solute receptor
MYPGQDKEVSIARVSNLLICNKDMKDTVAYDIVKTLFEHKQELVAVHKMAEELELAPQADGSPLPFHPGAAKYFKEKGVNLK